MSIYSDKLAHVEVVINCQYFVAQSCTSEDGLAYSLGAPSIHDVMSYNLLTTLNFCQTQPIKVYSACKFGHFTCFCSRIWSSYKVKFGHLFSVILTILKNRYSKKVATLKTDFQRVFNS